MLKRILIALVALIIVFVAVVAMQPDEFKVERTATIAAEPAAVFEQVNDFHNWEAWSPWAKLDPDAKVSFEGAPAGTGSVFKWSGNDQVGEGSMMMTESLPNQVLMVKTRMVKPMEMRSETQFSLKPNGAGTDVTWTMSGQHNFISKAMCLVMNGTKMLGGEMGKGLAEMKKVVEAPPQI
jgi:hypothetical protein